MLQQPPPLTPTLCLPRSQAKRCLDQAVQFYLQMGRLGVAARLMKDTAEVAEKEGDKEARA